MTPTIAPTDNAQQALENYKQATKWGWPLDKAISYAAGVCTCPAELDKLQILINKEFIKETASVMHDFLQSVAEGY